MGYAMDIWADMCCLYRHFDKQTRVFIEWKAWDLFR